jgi:pre-mRNA-splicing factor 38A
MGLNEEVLIDRLVEIDHICGSYGANRRPSKFLCLLLKTLQIQPAKDIVHELIQSEDFKCV